MIKALTIAMLLPLASVPQSSKVGLNLIERALSAPAHLLANRGDLQDQLAATIDIAYGLNGAKVDSRFTALFNDDPAKHSDVVQTFQRAGMSEDDFLDISKCLNVLSDPAVAKPTSACGSDADYKRLSAAWAEAKAKPVDQANPTSMFEFRIYIDDKWYGTSRCLDTTCIDEPVDLKILHLGPNVYRIIMADGTGTDGYYDPESLTLSAPFGVGNSGPEMTFHMSPDGATVSGMLADDTGHILRFYSLHRVPINVGND